MVNWSDKDKVKAEDHNKQGHAACKHELHVNENCKQFSSLEPDTCTLANLKRGQ